MEGWDSQEGEMGEEDREVKGDQEGEEMEERLVSKTRELVGYGKTVLQCLQAG